ELRLLRRIQLGLLLPREGARLQRTGRRIPDLRAVAGCGHRRCAGWLGLRPAVSAAWAALGMPLVDRGRFARFRRAAAGCRVSPARRRRRTHAWIVLLLQPDHRGTVLGNRDG